MHYFFKKPIFARAGVTFLSDIFRSDAPGATYCLTCSFMYTRIHDRHKRPQIKIPLNTICCYISASHPPSNGRGRVRATFFRNRGCVAVRFYFFGESDHFFRCAADKVSRVHRNASEHFLFHRKYAITR
jgi:hypothetical protein